MVRPLQVVPRVIYETHRAALPNFDHSARSPALRKTHSEPGFFRQAQQGENATAGGRTGLYRDLSLIRIPVVRRRRLRLLERFLLEAQRFRFQFALGLAVGKEYMTRLCALQQPGVC